MLPAEITTEAIRQTNDELDLEDDSFLERVSDGMADYADAIIEKLAERYSLTDEQREELCERLAYRFELLPAGTPPCPEGRGRW